MADLLDMNASKLEEVHNLWDALADFPASRSDDALRYLMGHLSDWLGAKDVVWVGAARLLRGAGACQDPQRGWRGLVVRHLRLDPLIVERSIRVAQQQDTEPGMTTLLLVANAGKFRVHHLYDGSFVDLSAFKKTVHYRAFYQEVGIVDRMFVGFPINEDTESFFLFDRMDNSQPFTRKDAQLVGYVMRGLKWFHQRLLLSHGLLLARTPLTAMERKIVHYLLTERSEKEIAAELEQSPTTTHKYVTGILRKFGVHGRAGLMALWLGATNQPNIRKHEQA